MLIKGRLASANSIDEGKLLMSTFDKAIGVSPEDFILG